MHPDASCWHEAGHAVIAWILGVEVRLVSLESELDDHEGHVEVAWQAAADERDRLHRSAMVAAAGPLAELVYRGEDDLEDPDVLSAWRRDRSEFERCTRLLAESNQERAALARRIVGEVRLRLRDPEVEERVARVADMLAAHGILDVTLFEDAVR
ncbi:MAG: hypothetical protein KDB80_09700 [Planctomycetes bacterium]|nr:hypothetical protein [Planctomycetota bacterium]